MPVQKTVNMELPAAYHGDFASANPRFSEMGAENAWRAGASGVQAGSFVWVDEATGMANNTGTGTPDGFVRRGGLSLIGAIPQAATMTIPAGTPLTVYDLGEFWIKLPTGVTATRKQPVYADPTTGAVIASTGSGAVQTRYFYAQSTTPGEMVKISGYLGPVQTVGA